MSYFYEKSRRPEVVKGFSEKSIQIMEQKGKLQGNLIHALAMMHGKYINV